MGSCAGMSFYLVMSSKVACVETLSLEAVVLITGTLGIVHASVR